jgi:L,D-peptidoglycan transpeptidase YkuD (ErfK/YbiS/YcfS/YnhG family)
MSVKVFFIVSLLLQGLCAADQLLLVVSESFSAPTATLQRYVREKGRYHKTGKAITVNLGRSGLGWGIGEPFPRHEGDPIKQEGDGRAPAGVFALNEVFGYARSAATKMPYLHAGRDLICIDDSVSPFYNRIKTIDRETAVRSFEWMRRDDDLYTLGVTVAHNSAQKPQAGSCIFLHVQKGPGAPTSGCTSMALAELREIVRWLDPEKKPLLVQVPKAYCDVVMERFPGVECP